jgi:hypothetical protein
MVQHACPLVALCSFFCKAVVASGIVVDDYAMSEDEELVPERMGVRRAYRKSTVTLSGGLWRTLQMEFLFVWAVWFVFMLAYSLQEPTYEPWNGLSPLKVEAAAGAAHLPVTLLAAYAIETVFSRREPIYYMTKLTWLIPLLVSTVVDAAAVVSLWSRWRFGPLYPSAASWPFFSAVHVSVFVVFDLVYLILISMAQYRHGKKYPVPSEVKSSKRGEYASWSFENVVLIIGLAIIIVGSILAIVFFNRGRE